MKYKNIKTGNIIDVNSEINGGDWVKAQSSSDVKEETNDEPVKKRTKKS